MNVSFLLQLLLVSGIVSAGVAASGVSPRVTTQFPSTLPASMHNPAFPYGYLSLLQQDMTWALHFAPNATQSSIRGALQPSVYNPVEDAPHFIDGQCDAFVADNGTVTTSVASPGACGDFMVHCKPMHPDYSLPVVTRECPSCAPLRFPRYLALFNRSKLTCGGYPMLHLSTDTPLYFGPQYAYAAWTRGGPPALNAATFAQQMWNGTNPSIVITEDLKNVTVLGSPANDTQIVVFVPNETSFDTTKPLTVTPATSNATVCTVGDIGTFTASAIAPGERGPDGYFYNCEIYQMRGYESANQGVWNCLRDNLCVGFTLRYDNDGTAPTADCYLYRSATARDKPTPYLRGLYLRLSNYSNRACSTVAGYRGLMDVFIEHTNIQNTLGEFQLYVNEVFIRRCSPSTANRCNTFTRCAGLSVEPGSVVRVAYSGASASMTCGKAIRTVFVLSTLNDTIVAPTVPRDNAPLALQNDILAGAYPIMREILVANAFSRARLLVNNLDNVVVQVGQTGYNTNNAVVTTADLHFSFLNNPHANNSMKCGGNYTFAGGVRGLSTQCSTSYLCSDTPLVKGDGGTPGYLVVGGNIPSILSRATATTARCETPPTNTQGGVRLRVLGKLADPQKLLGAGFPLVMGTTNDFFNTFYLDTARSSPDIFLESVYAGSLELQELSGLIGVSDAKMYAVDWRTVDRRLMSATTTLSCTVDFMSVFAYCNFKIPINASRAVIWVENHNLVFDASAIFAYFRGSPTAAPVTKACGGSRGLAHGDVAVTGNCGEYVRCVDSNLADVNGNLSYTHITVGMSIPLGSVQICSSAVNIRVAFTTNNTAGNILTQGQIECNAAGNLYCPGLTLAPSCVPRAQVCDGTLQCGNSGDEVYCSKYNAVEHDLLPALGALSSVVLASDSLIECKRRAIANESSLFAFNGTACVVYTSRSAVTEFFVSPTSYLVSAERFVLYANVSSRTAYGRCTDAFSCNSHGTAFRIAGRTPCYCRCESSYSGDTCNVVNRIGPSLTVSITVELRNPSLSREYALRLLAVTLSITAPFSTFYNCAPLLPLYQDQPTWLTALCTYSGGYQITSISAGLVDAFRRQLSVFSAAISVQVFQLLPSPGFEIMNNCSSTLNGTSSCGFPVAIPSASLLVVSKTLKSVAYNVTLLAQDVSDSATRRRSGSAAVVASFSLSCVLSNEVDSAGCLASSCVIPLNDLFGPGSGSPGILSASVVLTTLDNTTMSPADMCESPMIVYREDFFQGRGSPQMETPAVILNRTESFTGYIIAGSVIMVLGVLLLAAGFFLKCLTSQQEDELLRQSSEDTTVSPLQRILRDTLIKMHFYENPRRAFKLERWNVVFRVAGVVVAIFGVLFVILWLTSEEYDSNVQIVVERFGDSRCESSLVTPTPLDAYIIDDTTSKKCLRRPYTGTENPTFFSAGQCEQLADGNIVARIRASNTAAGCEKATTLIVPVDVCVPSGSLWGLVSDYSYSKVSCATTASATSTFAYMSGSATMATPSTPTAVLDIGEELQTNWTHVSELLDDVTPVYKHVFRYLGVAFTTLSEMPWRTAVILQSASTTAFVKSTTGVFGGRKFPILSYIIQYASEVFASPSPKYSTPQAAALDMLDAGLALPTPNTDAVRSVAPPMAEYPVGVLYNRFNLSYAVAGAAAESGAQSFFNVRGSPFDAARVLNYDTVQEGEGMTIQFFVKATPLTKGFVYIVMDAYEDAVQSKSPILELLSRIIENNLDGSKHWFNHTYHVYSAVHLDGSNKELSFVYADPDFFTPAASSESTAASGTVTLLRWNLADIGAERVLNGAWHLVSIVLSMRNKQHIAQLFVDGETSDSAVGWNQCVRRGMTPIPALAVGAQVYVDSQDYSVTTGGVLRVGALNGGVAKLEFVSRPLNVFDIYRQSSAAVRERNLPSSDQYVSLGSLLVIASAIFAILLIATSLRNVIKQKATHAECVVANAFFTYTEIVAPRLLECDLAGDGDPVEYKILSSITAMRWLGLVPAQLGPFLEELKKIHGDSVLVELIKTLYIAKNHSRISAEDREKIEVPGAEQWNALVEADREEQHRIAIEYQNSFAKFFVAKPDPEEPLGLCVADMCDELPVCPSSAQQDAGIPAAVDGDTTTEGGTINDEATSDATRRTRRSRVAFVRTEQKALRSAKEYTRERMAQQATSRRVGRINADSNITTANGANNGQETRGTRPPGGLAEDPITTIEAAAFGSLQWSFAFSSELFQFLSPVFSVVQLVFVWMNSLNIAEIYDRYFRSLFAIISIDFVQIFPNVPELVTPIVQMLIGIVAFTVLVYYLALDDYNFAWYLARYTLKRDKVDNEGDQDVDESASDTTSASGAGSSVTPMQDLGGASNNGSPTRAAKRSKSLSARSMSLAFRFLKRLGYDAHSRSRLDLAHMKQLDKEYEKAFDQCSATTTSPLVHLLSVGDTFELYAWLMQPAEPGKATKNIKLRRTPLNALVALPPTEEPTASTLHLQITNDVDPSDAIAPRISDVEVFALSSRTASGLEYAAKLSTLDHYCRVHKDRRLVPQVQNAVFPFKNAPQCCAVENNVRCTNVSGLMFHCGHRYDDPTTGEREQCGYCLCEKHFRGGVSGTLLSEWSGLLQTARLKGLGHVIAALFLVFALSAYTPIVKTAFMILACHPSYQCSLGDCWKAPLRSFLFLAYLCASALGLFGLGLPVLWFVQLYRRMSLIKVSFFSPEYGKKYTEPQQDEDDSSAGVSEDPSYVEENPLLPVQPLCTPSDSTRPATAVNIASGAPQKTSDAERLEKQVVRLAEWSRFLTHDPTIMSTLYRTLNFENLFFSPLLLVCKAMLIAPAVFIPANTFEHTLGIALVEFAFGVFLFWRSPFISPMVDLMYRLGCVHQLSLLGVQCFDVVERYKAKPRPLGGVMIGITLVYLAVCACCIVWAVIGPLLYRAYNRRVTAAALSRFGLRPSWKVAQVVVPVFDRPVLEALAPTLSPSQQALAPATAVPVEGSEEQRMPQPTQEEETVVVAFSN